MSFSSLGLSAELLRGVADVGWQHPTALQDLIVPPALEGRDLLVVSAAQGKTAAYLLPVLHRILQGETGRTRGLILTPDGATGAKIDEWRARLASHTRTTGAVVFGGVDKTPQERSLKAGADVVVATPGRLREHMEESYGRLYDLQVLVIDDAHRMAELGLLPDVEHIVENLPAEIQVLLFSESLSPPLTGLVRVLREPVEIELASEAEAEAEAEAEETVEPKTAAPSGSGQAAESGASAKAVEPGESEDGSWKQAVYPVEDDLKPALLAALVEQGGIQGALVLTRTRHRANRVASLLRRLGLPADRVHGNRSQAQRSHVLEQFRGGKLKALVATDLPLPEAMVDHLTHLVYLDLPASTDDYAQRCREASASGLEVIALAAPTEGREFKNLDAAHGPLPEQTLEGFDYQAKPEEPLEIPPEERRGRRDRKGSPPRRNQPSGRERSAHAPDANDGEGRRRRRRRKGTEGAGPPKARPSRGQGAPRAARGGGDNAGNVKRRRGKAPGIPPESRPDYDPENYGNRTSDPDPYSGRMRELVPSSRWQRREDPAETGRPVDQQGRPTHKPSYGRFGRRD
jgi:ATP-dependent RNA helicase RhlE